MTSPAQSQVNPYRDATAEPQTTRVHSTPVIRTEHQESLLTRMIEHQSAKIPSNVFLFASLAAMVVSAASELTGRQRASRFVGMWVNPLLTMGLYNKLVKTFGAE